MAGAVRLGHHRAPRHPQRHRRRSLAQLSVNIGWSVLLTAALSFIGAGVVAPTPEWGSMIAMGFQNIVTGHGGRRSSPAWRWPSPCSASPWSAPASRCWPIRTRRAHRLRRGSMAADADAARRLHRPPPLFMVPQLFGIVLVSFFLVKLIPGDPAVMMLGPTATPEAWPQLRDKMGLDQPLLEQFLHLSGRCRARRPRHVLADHAAGHRGSVPALPGDAGAGHLRPAAGHRHRRPAGRRRRPPQAQVSIAQGRRLSTACWPAPCPTSGWHWC